MRPPYRRDPRNDGRTTITGPHGKLWLHGRDKRPETPRKNELEVAFCTQNSLLFSFILWCSFFLHGWLRIVTNKSIVINAKILDFVLKVCSCDRWSTLRFGLVHPTFSWTLRSTWYTRPCSKNLVMHTHESTSTIWLRNHDSGLGLKCVTTQEYFHAGKTLFYKQTTMLFRKWTNNFRGGMWEVGSTGSTSHALTNPHTNHDPSPSHHQHQLFIT